MFKMHKHCQYISVDSGNNALQYTLHSNTQSGKCEAATTVNVSLFWVGLVVNTVFSILSFSFQTEVQSLSFRVSPQSQEILLNTAED